MLVQLKKMAVLSLLVALSAGARADNRCVAPTVLASDNYDTVQSKENSCLRRTVNLPADFHMLVFSWSPGFCQQKKDAGKLTDDLKFQCVENSFKWVVHGLWAELNQPEGCVVDPSKSTEQIPLHPRYCKGDLPKIDPEVIKRYMCIVPGAPLIQGEWEKHGACSFPTPEAYLNKIRLLTESLVLPDELMTPPDLIGWMQSHNAVLQGRRLEFDGKHTELHVCYTIAWDVMDCPVSTH